MIEPGAACTLALPNGAATVTPTPHPEFGGHIGPLETVMVAVTADAPGCDAAFLTPRQLVEHLDLPASTRALFFLDQWSHPAAGDAASDSPDLVLTVEALRGRRAIAASVTGHTRDDHLRDRMGHIVGWGADW